ncbi:MAG: DUF1003 domain-containing protein [Dermatophilaceae bacterium]
MADRDRRPRIDQPREGGRRWSAPTHLTEETFGVVSEKFARFMGTPYFLIGMTLVVAFWVLWNTVLPEPARFDPYAFIFLTLVLSLQASYAAPLILLAQNRQADRDRVALEQDRARDERNLADTEYLTREVAALRLAMRDTATRDFVRGELRDLLDELEQRGIVVLHRESPHVEPRQGADEEFDRST